MSSGNALNRKLTYHRIHTGKGLQEEMTTTHAESTPRYKITDLPVTGTRGSTHCVIAQRILPFICTFNAFSVCVIFRHVQGLCESLGRLKLRRKN